MAQNAFKRPTPPETQSNEHIPSVDTLANKLNELDNFVQQHASPQKGVEQIVPQQY